MAQVNLDNVRKTYPGGFEAVRGLSLDIADGEFIVLVGPSGCGKTTTLRLVAGLEDITGGEVRIGDRVVNDVHPKDRDIAMVFQKYALYPHMSAYKNMAFALKLRKVPRDEIDRRVRAVASMLGIEELLERKPAKLSGGQQQRVAVGRAIVRQPKAFLFDEPLSNLDAKLRVTTRAELKALHHRLKTTTIYVTHDQEEAMTLGDRIVVMHQGLIQQADTPLAVYRHPANRFVASFIGTPPMNFLEGTLAADGPNPGALAFIENPPKDASPGHSGVRLPLPQRLADRLRSHANRPVSLGLRPTSFRDAGGFGERAAEVGDAGYGGAAARIAGTGGASSGAMPLPAVSDQASIMLDIRVIEPLGDSMDVFATTPGGHKVVARIPARENLAPSGSRPFTVDMSQAHLFEPGELGGNLIPG